MKIIILQIVKQLFLTLLVLMLAHCSFDGLKDTLTVHFEGDAKIEVGSEFVGIEMHHSSPLLQRISFYYPVANSIDLSTDYWKRDTSFISALGLKIGDDETEWLGRKKYKFDQTPYTITFNDNTEKRNVKITYKFCMNKPAFVVQYDITNNTAVSSIFEFETHFSTILRTCHSFTKKDKAWTEYNPHGFALFTNFEDYATQNAQVFVANTGEEPVAYNGNLPFADFNMPDGQWCPTSSPATEFIIAKENMAEPGVHYKYENMLAPSQTMTIVQIIGSCKQEEGKEIVKYLLENYETEIKEFENGVLNYVYEDAVLKTGDQVIDHSVNWAKAILAVNQHYLDGEVVPMPCPAEYNFYFSHDALVTDLSVVNFDLPRVKRDLDYIVRHADSEYIIPHAYYWRDTTYLTEYANHDNWNNFWFILVSASYLRHSGDTEFLKYLYPYLAKSVETMLKTKGDDDLIWSNRPDWWDIGRNFGANSYMTILAIKSLREYTFISSVLEKIKDKLMEYEKLADRMENQLVAKLWDENQKYLINYYEPGKVDTHYYTGSLLAAHFDLLDNKKMNELVLSARENLLDEKVGVYNAFPMDFHELREYLNFSGNEAGDQFFYFNGGIWPQGNAWYALSLIANDQKTDAYKFIKDIMTIDGLMKLPNGQPAMYEVRNGNFNDSNVYGTVDKPQFMWAAAWYLYCLYNLHGINENCWNISMNPYLNDDQAACQMTLTVNGDKILYNIEGKGNYIESISFDGVSSSSAVIPVKMINHNNVTVKLGTPGKPILTYTKAQLIKCEYNSNQNEMTIELKAFTGHKNITRIMSPIKPVKVVVNNDEFNGDYSVIAKDGIYEIEIIFIHKFGNDVLQIRF
ncbi:amylo-alpha-1,6-glucosidase [Bacteroidota bacterium]